MKLYHILFCHRAIGWDPVLGIDLYKTVIFSIICIWPSAIYSAAQTSRVTQQFASILRTLGPHRTPTGPAIRRTFENVPLGAGKSKQIFNASGRFVRPGTITELPTQTEAAPSQPTPAPIKTVRPISFAPIDRKEIFQTHRIEPDVAAELPQAATLATVLGIMNFAATEGAPSRLQEDNIYKDDAIETAADVRALEQQHVPIILPDHSFVAQMGELQRVPEVPLIGFKPEAESRVILQENDAVAIMPFYSGTVSKQFENKVLTTDIAPTIRVEFNPQVTADAPQGSLRVTLTQGKDTVINDLTDFSYLTTMIPKNYLPTFNAIISSPTPVGMSLWHDTTQAIPMITLQPEPSSPLEVIPAEDQPARVQDQEALTPVPDLHAILATSNLIGVLAFNLPETLNAPAALPAPATTAPALKEPTKQAEQSASPGPGYQRIINAYKAQLALIKQLEQLGNMSALLEQAEQTIIRIAHMLSEHSTPDAMRMLRQSGVDRNELLSWVAAG